MRNLETIEAELQKVLRENAERPSPALLEEANRLRREYVELDVKLSGGKK